MSSELRVDQLNTVAGGTGNISVTNGVKLTGSAGSIAAPGQVIQIQQYYLGNAGVNDAHHTNATTSGTGQGTGGFAFGRVHAVTTTSTTPTASDFQVNITPTAANSLIRIEFNYYFHVASHTANSANCKVVRTISGGTATSIWQPATNTTSAFGMNYHGVENTPHQMSYLQAYDKPNTTSSVNYRIYYYNYSSGGTCHYFGYAADNHWAPQTALTVMEIAQ